MVNKKILILSTYPIEESLHGGQKRVEAIVNFYKGVFDEVLFVAVFHGKFFDNHGLNDIAIEDPEIIKAMERSPFASDIISGEAIYADAKVKQKITKILHEYQPDVIQVEQIFPFAGIKPLLKELDLSPKLVLSSQNDETRLKKDIFTGIKMPKPEKKTLIDKVAKLERKASEESDLVIAVNKGDAEWHRKLGAKKCIVIPNGISKIDPTQAALDHWQKFKEQHRVSSLVTFVGSAHPPNLIGFQAMIDQDLSFLPDDACIMLAGGVSNYIQQEYGEEDASAKKFWQKAWPLGKLSDDNLAALIQQSEVIILPITSGVGSNLKTAEAILADKKVVATNLAFCTFEQYSALPNIYFADNKTQFKNSILKIISADKIQRTQEQSELADKVQWQYCLRPLAKELEVMVAGRTSVFLRKVKRKLFKRGRQLLPFVS